jgi:hypothetical protein
VQRRPPAEPELQVLTAPDASRLLARASELDAAGGAATIAQLRAAAIEAGISPLAFEAALEEVRAQNEAPVPAVVTAAPRGTRRRTLVVAALALVALATVLVSRAAVVPRSVAAVQFAEAAAVPMIEEAFLLRCLTAAEAAQLIRPLLGLPANTVVSSERTPRVLTVRATADQMARVRELLAKHEAVAAPACAVAPGGAAR